MNYYFAPMEGITGYLFRRIHHEIYPGVDKYFIPYVEPHEKRAFNARERSDISPENNIGMQAIPQILTKDAEGFVRMSRFLADEGGYTEVNLNLGCPSGTVVSKGKGAGFLGFVDELHSFLEYIFEHTACDISIKTRIGRLNDDEFPELLKMYNEYPVKELIIHPRTREDYYKLPVRPDSFTYAMENTDLPLCYNGDIFSVENYQAFEKRFPGNHNWMLGRGLVSNPQLVEMISAHTEFDIDRFKAFHWAIYRTYGEHLSGDQNLLMKMKELWYYWINLFPENKKAEKLLKKARSKSEYEIAAQNIINSYM